jgi:hypothetical protein
MDRDLVAFELRPEFEPTFDGDVQTSGFAGAVLAAPRGDLHVRDQLAAGDGRITLRGNRDSGLVELLRQYPPLVEVATDQVDRSSAFLSPYALWDLGALQAEAGRRELPQADSSSPTRLVSALDEHDDAVERGDLVYPAPPPAPEPTHVATRAELEALTKDQLLEEVDGSIAGITQRSEPAEIVAAMLAVEFELDGAEPPPSEPQPPITDRLGKDVLVLIASDLDVAIEDSDSKAQIVEKLAAAGHTTIPTPEG